MSPDPARRATTLAFGGAALARSPGAQGDADAALAVQAALEAGIAHFDTAPYYGQGLSEARLGQALRWVPRERFQVSTKIGFRLDGAQAGKTDAWAASLPGAVRPDFSYDGAWRSIALSQARLGLGRIDTVLVHGFATYPDAAEAAVAGAFPALYALRQRGEVTAIGAGVNDPAKGIWLLDRVDLDILLLAGGLSLGDASAADGLLALCTERGVRVLPAAPFTGVDFAADTALVRACAASAIDPRAAAVQFPLLFAGVDCVLAGMRLAEQVRGTMAAFRQPIAPDFWKPLLEAVLARADLIPLCMAQADILYKERINEQA